MQNQGVLKLRIKLGESIYIGDSEVKLDEISESGYSASLVIKADKSLKVVRSAVLEKEYWNLQKQRS